MELSKDKFIELFEYRNGGLYWKVSVGTKIQPGRKAGSLDGKGYKRVKINQKDYRVHRIIFMMNNGYMPKYVDHIDGNVLNNKIDNLRETTLSQNQFNKKLSCNNTSGVKGVYWSKQISRWVARCKVNGKNTQIGCFKEIEDAKKEIEKYREILHGSFARHA